MFRYSSPYLFCTILLSVLLLNACSSTPPALTSGSDTWPLKTVTYPSSFQTPSGETITSKDPNLKILRAEFECPENKSLPALWLGNDNQALSSFSMYLPQGFSDVFITDTNGNKYSVVLIDNCSIVGLVPKDGTSFKLQFKDLEPVALEK